MNLGADAIWVSNNGGRIIDTAPSTISVLPSIAKVVKEFNKKNNKKVEIYLDGGIRRGIDVMKALAFGARAVFVGRPAIYGLARSGKDGVKEVLEMLHEEFKLAMVLTHCMSIEEVTEEQVIHKI